MSSCVFPIALPGNEGESRSGTQSSNLREEDAASRGRKNGRRMIYADARLSRGNTRSVPSPGPVLDIAVQPCHARKIEHAFLAKMSVRSLKG